MSAPGTLPGSPSSHLDLKGSLQQLSPTSLAASVASQFLGEKTDAQKAEEQKKSSQAQRLQQLNQQEYQRTKAAQHSRDQGVIQETLQLKSQAKQMAEYDPGSAVLTQTTGPDISEQSIVLQAMKDARARKEREARARQLMSQKSSVKKGPQPEGGEGKVSMVDKMATGQETSANKKDDQDALQRQAEQAIGE